MRAYTFIFIGCFFSSPLYAWFDWQDGDFRFRGGFEDTTTLGNQAPEEFDAWDIAAQFKVTKLQYSAYRLKVGMRVMFSAGILTGAKQHAFLVSAIPLFTFSDANEHFVLDAGAGGALMSRTTFGRQTFGEAFQFGLTTGVTAHIYKNLGLGYRFQHYSDAGIHGENTTGADLHMIELSYFFNAKQW